MSDITINDAEINAALEKLVDRLENPRKLMQDIGEFMVGSTKARFTQGVDPEGTPWAAKSLATIASYRSRAGKSPNSRVDVRPLFGPTGTLSSTINYEASDEGVLVGSARVYAAVMQFGAKKGEFGSTKRGQPIPFGNIPARPYLGVSDSDRTSLGEIIAEWLSEGIDTD